MRKHSSLFSHSRDDGGVGMIELEDEEVKHLVSGISFDDVGEDTFHDVLSVLYHSEDVEVGDMGPVVDSAVSRSRYFCDTKTCFHCGETGHEIKECRRTHGDICEFCSRPGHIRFHCPHRFCSRCRWFGHSSSSCREQRDASVWKMCKTCPVGRHPVAECPGVWRRYKLERGRQEGQMNKCCAMCLSDTHFIDDCSSTRPQSSVFSSSLLRHIRFYDKKQRKHTGGGGL